MRTNAASMTTTTAIFQARPRPDVAAGMYHCGNSPGASARYSDSGTAAGPRGASGSAARASSVSSSSVKTEGAGLPFEQVRSGLTARQSLAHGGTPSSADVVVVHRNRNGRPGRTVLSPAVPGRQGRARPDRRRCGRVRPCRRPPGRSRPRRTVRRPRVNGAPPRSPPPPTGHRPGSPPPPGPGHRRCPAPHCAAGGRRRFGSSGHPSPRWPGASPPGGSPGPRRAPAP